MAEIRVCQNRPGLGRESQRDDAPTVKSHTSIPKKRAALAQLDPNSLPSSTSTPGPSASASSSSSAPSSDAAFKPPRDASKGRSKRTATAQSQSVVIQTPVVSDTIGSSGKPLHSTEHAASAATQSTSGAEAVITTSTVSVQEPVVALIDFDKALQALSQFSVRYLFALCFNFCQCVFNVSPNLSVILFQFSAVVDAVTLRLLSLAALYSSDNAEQVGVIDAVFRAFDRFRAFLLIMTSQLIGQFRTSSSKKLGAFEDLRRNWSRIQQSIENYRHFVGVFTDASQTFQGDQALFTALCRTPIYAECMRTIYFVLESVVRQWRHASMS